MSLSDKRILLGISGGIAAYKSADLVRRLKERGAEVRVVMTASAKEFITPLTLQALSGNPVGDSLLDPNAEAAMGHIELAKWADLILVAPASANVLARINAGLADDLLTTLILASAAPLAVAPAMNQQMYRAAATQANLEALARRGVAIWGPNGGEQACGDVGPGRMKEPLELVAEVERHFGPKPLAGRKLVITAGPTREPLDPVRYLSNHSSGKMGFALAQAAAELGADVTLVSGPVSLATPLGVRRLDVESALEMHEAALIEAAGCDLFIGCAAVADYRPAQHAEHKIKKDNDKLVVEMVKNPDIISDVAAMAQRPGLVVGFAAETRDVEHYARDKLARKKLDWIAANAVGRGLAFGQDDNQLTLIGHSTTLPLPQADKLTLARQMLAHLATQLSEAK
ncbi:bifunctional phosphopantothenoylcysteine decarboxylase/phosphopantothenate--cysteine ligase CoaBC [Gallaecimonas kandeliae]|uniref:bifunctional phosphopantothenoylcysteine decarboxylase/phosphopantothenate--cysteine ligase CoaBC n=1 Tax=Gallaecimonas kandeliae TaxID=3029055 RepID=UPI002649D134|nr:bifunctional phosphopantothenoylcysteine decarboxylase/phosphopantothenate--cysteine ligase CoaBC [Gallaecimonas kandeliae]WKE65802.1 bifunctional phosphopantothenoylcysteine decarboxylase/phosphopantothenate--cysteine ligase CoaBC [Gallaecimonas kandeliae]